MSEKLWLQWRDFKKNAIALFGNIKDGEDFLDVTLFRFSKTFSREKHPLIYMRGVKSHELLGKPPNKKNGKI